jgi:predicted phage terminase large subunit-like protein
VITINILEEILSDSSGKSPGVSLYDKSAKEKAAVSLEFFCKHYFADIFASEFCDFHYDVFRTLEDAILKNPNRKQHICRAAPRSHGKSQVISMALPLWCICFGYRKNIVIVSDTGEQVEQFILDIKNNLEDNELLLADFGNLVQRKKIWRQREIATDNDIHLVGKSAGQSLRGIKYNSVRPDLIIIDDLENDENVETDGQRVKLYNWFTKVLLKCGGVNPIFTYIGTVINYSALLYKVINSVQFSRWNRASYKAVYKFSDSPLWEQWEKIMSDLTLGNNAKDKAYDFYKKHQKEMLKNVKTLWPQKEEDYYYNLMMERFEDEESFNSELQNDPLTDDMRIFKIDWLDRSMYSELPDITEVWYSVDVSMGKSKKSDTSAIIGVGKGIDNYYYVLEADVQRKRSPDIIIEDMAWHISKYYDKLKGFAVETDVFLEFVAKIMKDRLVEKGLYVNWVELKQAQNGSKELRIKSLTNPIKHGYIRFHESQRELLKQLRNYPKDSDDAVDALQMVMSIIYKIESSSFSFGGISSQPKSQSNDMLSRISRYFR